MRRVHILIILMLSFFIIFSGCDRGKNNKRKMAEYREMVRSTGNVIMKQASGCFSQFKSYVTAWEYAKVTGTDFHAAVDEILGERNERLKEEMRKNRWAIHEIMVKLRDSPPELIDCYKKLDELYGIYLEIHSLAMNPSEAMENFDALINDLQSRLEEKKKELDEFLIH